MSAVIHGIIIAKLVTATKFFVLGYFLGAKLNNPKKKHLFWAIAAIILWGIDTIIVLVNIWHIWKVLPK